MKLVLIFVMVSSVWVLGATGQAQVEFCGNKLKGTESGKEEHYVKYYKCDTLSSCTYIDRTEEQNMEDDKPWRCWSQRLNMNPVSDLNKFVKVDIYESDNNGAGDDHIGEAIVQFSELMKIRKITVEVTNGDGQIQFNIYGIS